MVVRFWGSVALISTQAAIQYRSKVQVSIKCSSVDIIEKICRVFTHRSEEKLKAETRLGAESTYFSADFEITPSYRFEIIKASNLW